MFPWRGYTAIEWQTGFAGAFCGKILAQGGARVIRYRNDASWPRSTPAPKGWDLFLDREKDVRRLSDAGGEAALGDMLAEADCLIVEQQDKTSAEMAFPLNADTCPGLLTVAISPFGRSGPYSEYRGDELAIGALSGFLDATPGLPDWRPDGEPPARCLAPLMEFAAGAVAACVAQASLLGMGRGLRPPRTIEVSKLEVASGLMISEWGLASYGGIAPGRRRKSRNIEPNCFLPCRNGYITIIATTDERWQRLVEIMGSPEWALDERFSTAEGRAEHAEVIHRHLAVWAREVDGNLFMEAAQARGLPCTAYRTLAEVISEKHLWEVEALEMSDGHKLPADPVRVNGSRRRYGALGTRDAVADRSEKRPTAPSLSKGAAPLSGVKVLDLTQMVAGPMTGQYLAALGADVTLVESRRHLVSRAFGPFGGEPHHDASNNFNHVNRGKESVELDLTTERGRALFDQLVAAADIVLENFSRRASTKLGLSYDALRSVNRSIILASISAFGRGGRWGGYISHHAGVAALSGLTSIVQDENGQPRVVGAIFPDVMTGTYTAGAIMQALAKRDATGEGCAIEVSMLDVMLACMGGFIAAGSTEGLRGPMPFVPTGDGGFVAVDEIEPGEIDQLVEALADKSKLDAMKELQAQGRSAGAVLNALEVISNEHLLATGFIEELDHAAVGRRKLAGVPWLCDERRPALGVAPCLGSATEAVMTRLGLGPSQINRLRKDRVLW